MPPGYGYGQKGINMGKPKGGNLGPNQPPGVKAVAIKPKPIEPTGKSMNTGETALLSGMKNKNMAVPPPLVPGGPSMNTGGKRRKAG